MSRSNREGDLLCLRAADVWFERRHLDHPQRLRLLEQLPTSGGQAQLDDSTSVRAKATGAGGNDDRLGVARVLAGLRGWAAPLD